MVDKVNKGRLTNQWTKTNTCKKGHTFNDENIVYQNAPSGNKVKRCKTCYTYNYKRVNELNKLKRMSKYKASDVLGFRTSKDTL